MPLWNACLTAVCAGLIGRNVYLTRQQAKKLAMTSPDVPAQISKMMRKLARKMNIKNIDTIKLTMHDDLNCSAKGVRVLPSDPIVIALPRVAFDQEYAKTRWTQFEQLCNQDGIPFDLIGKSAREVRLMFGWNVPRNVLKYNIAHELTHVKYNDQLKTLAFSSVWLLVTTWPATSFSLAQINKLHSLGYLNFELISSIMDPLLLFKVVGVVSLWMFSAWLNGICSRRLDFMQEFRADRTAAEINTDIAEGALTLLNAERNFNKQCLRLPSNSHLRKEYDAKGNHRASRNHPTTEERIKAVEKVVEMHKARKNSESI